MDHDPQICPAAVPLEKRSPREQLHYFCSMPSATLQTRRALAIAEAIIEYGALDLVFFSTWLVLTFSEKSSHYVKKFHSERKLTLLSLKFDLQYASCCVRYLRCHWRIRQSRYEEGALPACEDSAGHDSYIHVRAKYDCPDPNVSRRMCAERADQGARSPDRGDEG